jgi:GST-like protein
MIDLYTWATPNGHKVHIMLEECGFAYTTHAVHIGRGDQFDPAFLAISPNNKIPAIVDRDGPGGQPAAVFESGAILIYLAEKTGRFLPASGSVRYAALQWLMFQMSAVGPMFGQCYHFRTDATQKIDYAIDRFVNEARRLYGIMDRRLGESEYLAGDQYTIADMATYPWTHGIAKQGHDPGAYPNVARWQQTIAARPGVRRGVSVLKEQRRLDMTDAEREVLFGARQRVQR